MHLRRVGLSVRLVFFVALLVAPPLLLISDDPTDAAATAVFGNTTVGASSDKPGSGYKFGSVFPLSESGTTVSISWYARGGGAPQKFTPVVYRADGQGNPTSFVTKGAEVQINRNQAAGWVTSSLPAVSLTSGNYLLGLLSGPNGESASISYAPAAGRGLWNANPYPTPTTSWGQVNRDEATWSVYVTYTPATSVPAPANTALPTISGTAQVGQTLTASNGEWTNSPSGYTHQWQRCNSGGTACANVAAATSTTYAVVNGDVGGTLRVVATATNGGGSTSATSAPTAVVTSAPAPPANTTPPAITGTPQVGQSLTLDQGTWSGNPTPTLARRWQSCDGGSCSDVPGATGTTYVIAAADENRTLRAVVTATNNQGSAQAVTAPTAVVVPLPPGNTAAPVVTGTPQVGQSVGTSNGSWTNNPTAFAYQWQRCQGGSCSNIGGATSSSYGIVAGDAGFTLAAVVRASNAGGTTSASSAQTAVVTQPPAPPVNQVAPSISGIVQAGQTLTANDGTWSGNPAPTLSRQWRTCQSSTCSDVSGATGATYVPAGADVGKTIQVVVTGTNSSGTSSAPSAPTAAVAPAPSTNTFGVTTPGSQSSATGADYKFGSVYSLTTTATPTSFRWYVRGGPNAAQSFTPFIYNTNASGQPTTRVTQGARITIARNQPAGWVTSPLPAGITLQPGRYLLGLLAGSTGQSAFNYFDTGPSGSTYWNNNGTQTVPANWGPLNTSSSRWSFYVEFQPSTPAPVNTEAPTLSGTPQVGGSLATTDGTWTNNPTSYAYQWQRCDSGGLSCSNVTGATAATYAIAGADAGSTLRAFVTASNAGGSAAAISAPSAVVTSPPAAPVSTAPPTITGSAVVGQTLTADRGSWTGNPPPSLSQQWQTCGTGACGDVPGATGVTYQIAAGDEGRTIRVLVTATNSEGSVQVASTETSVVSASPPTGPVPFARLTLEPSIQGSVIEKTLADLDNDGNLDVVTGTQPTPSEGGTGGIYWYQFPPSGDPTDQWVKRTILPTGVAYEDMASDDVDGDGWTDVVAAVLAGSDRNVYWFENPGALGGNWQQHLIGSRGEGENTLAVGDLDGDGRKDVATNTRVYFKDSPTDWTERQYNTGYNSVALLDVGSGRGRINLAGNLPNREIAWFENPRERGGDARADPWTSHVVGAPYPCPVELCGGDPPFATAWTGDFNGDGRMDIVTGQAEGDQAPPGGLKWFEAPLDRAQPWIPHGIDAGFQLSHNVRVADIDGNGALDVIAGEQDQSIQKRLAVYYNDGAGNFTRQVLSTDGSHNVDVADVDHDGDVDILAGPHGFFGGPDPVQLFLNHRL
ncbi:MAG TPA: FG-GAP-like repeat-containing protein [Gaiellaceae bacterium]|jgi:hypothetical protein